MVTRYEDMPVGMYQKLAKIVGEGMPEDDANLATLAVLSGMSEEQLLDLPLPEFRAKMDAAGFLLVYPHPAQVRDTYELRGVRYHPTPGERKMTAGQYIDFQTYAKEDDRWAELLSCLLVPEGHTYNDGYDIEAVQAAIRDELCILDAIALRAFFLNSSLALTGVFQLYSARKMLRATEGRKAMRKKKKALRQNLRALLRSGAGWRTLTQWLKLPDALGTR